MAAALVLPRKLIDIINVVSLALTEAVFDIRAPLGTAQHLPLVLAELLKFSLLCLLGDHLHKFQLRLQGARPLRHCCILKRLVHFLGWRPGLGFL